MVKLTEELDPGLQEIHKRLDEYCNKNNIGYSIDCDEANEQGYLVNKCKKIHQLIDHMRQQIGKLKDRVVMSINPQPASPISGGQLPNVRKDGTLLHFAIKPLQDSITAHEDQIKSPTTKHIRDQAPYRSSFAKTRSFGGITRTSYTESRKMLGKIDPFSDRLHKSLNEHVEITFAEPDVLLTHAHRPIDGSSPTANKHDVLKNALSLESRRFENYIEMINNTEDEEILTMLESLSEESSENIKKLEAMLAPTPNESVPSTKPQI